MRPRSIAALLTLLFTLAAGAIVGAASVALYLELKRELSSRHAEELEAKLELVRHLASEVKDQGDWENLKRILDDMVIGHGELRIWLGAADGSAIYGGRALPEFVASAGAGTSVRREDGMLLRAASASLTPGDQQPAARAIVALDTRPTERTLGEFRFALAAATLIALAATAALGALVARRGLAPVRQLAAEAHLIDTARSARRLETDRLPAELQELGGAFNGVLDRLALSYSQLEAFNSDVAHELRSPLANLIGETEFALSRPREAAVYRDTLASNLEELERLKSMVNDMLFLARADRGDRVERAAPVDLAAEARKVLEYYEPSLDESGVTAEVDGTADAIADGALIRRALSNLVSNAIRHTPRGERFLVRLGHGDGDVEIAVENPGPPIAAAHLPHLFTRFFRADASRSAGDVHHGLGLAIVKAIALMHGGSVFAESHAGRTRIGLRLPELTKS